MCETCSCEDCQCLSGEAPNAVFVLKDVAPKLVEAFRHLQSEELELFCKKNLDYGLRNITKGLDPKIPAESAFILISLWTRVSDKVSRWQNLIMKGHANVTDETLLDTLQDISNYCNIAQLVIRGMWNEGEKYDK